MRWSVLALLMGLSAAVGAVEQVVVLALFPGKAMLEIDGRRKVLAAGETDRSGVRLLLADPRQATVLVDGVERVLQLGSAVRSSYAPATRHSLRLLGDGDSFFVDGLIDGKPVRMLVDTGATTVAISEREARQLGLRYVAEDSRALVNTASGTAEAYHVRLRSLKIGAFAFQDVEAVVVKGDSPGHVLLGMNVLNRFDIEHRSNLMILRSRH